MFEFPMLSQPSSLSPGSPVPVTTVLFLIFVVLPFSECHAFGIPHYAILTDSLLSLSDMQLISIHVSLGFDR